MKHFCQIYVYDECENFCYLYPTKITSKVQLHTVYTEYTDKSTTPAPWGEIISEVNFKPIPCNENRVFLVYFFS